MSTVSFDGVGETVGVTPAPSHRHMFDATTAMALYRWTR